MRRPEPFLDKLLCRVALLALLCGTVPALAAPSGVVVRAGIHDRFNRMVIDWPSPVKYTMSQDDGLVDIQFNRTASLNLGPFRAAKAPLIQDLLYDTNTQGVHLSFRIPANARVQAFWSGNSVAFDVLLMNKDKPDFAASKTPPADKPATPPADIASKPPTEEKPGRLNLSSAEPAMTPVQSAGPQKPEILTTPPTDMSVAEPAAGATTDARDAAGAASLAEDSAQTIIHVRPLSKTSLAAFVRAGRLWLVFDTLPDGVAPQIEGALADSLKNYTRQTTNAARTGQAVAFLFDLPPGVTADNITVKPDSLNWDIALQSTQMQSAASDFDLTVDNAKGLSLLTGQSASVFAFRDDAVGDTVWIVPVRSPLLRVAKPHRMAAVSMLPTLVGALIVPQQDGLSIVAKDNQILLQSPQAALPLSSVQDRELSAAPSLEQDDLFLLKLPAFPPTAKDFETRRQYLEAEMAQQKDETDKALQALDLARLYLREGYGPEAQGALLLAQGYVSNLSDTPAFVALQGMAYALAAKIKPALDTLAQPNVQGSKLGALWQAYTQAQDKNWEKAYLGFRAQPDALRNYDGNLAVRLALAAAESAVETHNRTDAQNFLKAIPAKAQLNAAQRAARDYLQASLWQQGTNLQQDQALTLLMNLSLGSDRFYRVKADMSLLDIKLASGEIKNKDAIDTLEKARFAWRGDRQEIMILQKLGQYYLNDKNPLQAMTMWRQALTLAQNDTDKTALRANLQDAFDRLFVAGDNKGMPPLQALSLYGRFKDLMPTGDKGAQAALQLADQLLQVDLVDEADTILQEQLGKDSGPDQKIALGTKLATIRLIARDSAGAVKALDDSEQPGMPADIAGRRLLLRARALADLQKTDEALALLDHPATAEGLSLRADIFWRLGRWADAAHDLEELIEGVTPQTAQNVKFTGIVMRLAIARALENDQAGLDQLNAQYGEIMAQAPQAKAFTLMTTASDNATGLSDIETLKSQVAGTELFEGVLKGF